MTKAQAHSVTSSSTHSKRIGQNISSYALRDRNGNLVKGERIEEDGGVFYEINIPSPVATKVRKAGED